MGKVKRILDSVHGYIIVPEEYCNNIIDTVHFQRLRRIEQTSGRTLFPSARHDRFIHSLGVYHLGCKIVESLDKRYQNFPKNKDSVFTSYKLACLLHDVGHTPFSHTFEDFYKINNNLKQILCDVIKEDSFGKDFNRCWNISAPHEILSAYIAVIVYGRWITENTAASLPLIARMIVGCKYSDCEKHSFENAFIDLIHGDIIDVDGIDYVCRDVWASGYSTNTLDVVRLIDSICIEKDVNENDQYIVCYTAKCLNEIDAVLNVKCFQQTNVITHHTVVYEQNLLKEAMKSAALFHIEGVTDCLDEERREKAIANLCSLSSYFQYVQLTYSKAKIQYPSDDDFVSLMKYIPDDVYVKQWLSRNYDLKPLWRSKADFFNRFPILIGKSYPKTMWLFSDTAKEFIAKTFGIDKNKIWILNATSKDKKFYVSKVKLKVGNEIKSYVDLFPNDRNSFVGSHNPFFYIYVPKGSNIEEINAALNKQLQLFVFTSNG